MQSRMVSLLTVRLFKSVQLRRVDIHKERVLSIVKPYPCWN